MLNVPQEEEYSQEKSSSEGPWDRGQECLMRQAFSISLQLLLLEGEGLTGWSQQAQGPPRAGLLWAVDLTSP